MKGFENWLVSGNFKYIKDNSQGVAYWSNGFWCGSLDDLYIMYNTPNKEQTKDTIVERVIERFKERSEVGIEKYGVTLDRTDLSTLQWMVHFREELMDGLLYLERVIQDTKKL